MFRIHLIAQEKNREQQVAELRRQKEQLEFNAAKLDEVKQQYEMELERKKQEIQRQMEQEMNAKLQQERLKLKIEMDKQMQHALEQEKMAKVEQEKKSKAEQEKIKSEKQAQETFQKETSQQLEQGDIKLQIEKNEIATLKKEGQQVQLHENENLAAKKQEDPKRKSSDSNQIQKQPIEKSEFQIGSFPWRAAVPILSTLKSCLFAMSVGDAVDAGFKTTSIIFHFCS